MKDVPIFITTKNRQSYLQKVVERLVRQGYWNLHLIDTGSTWGPMLDYQCTLRFPIHRVVPVGLPKHSLWNCGVLLETGYDGKWFVLTDDDIVPEGQDDWCDVLHSVLIAHPEYPKAGLALRIDDLPDHYAGKPDVIEWESKFWSIKLSPNVYEAEVDTTMALYRPGAGPGLKAMRLGGPWQAKHLDWYCNSSCPTDEKRYYRSNMDLNTGFWRNESIAGRYQD